MPSFLRRPAVPWRRHPLQLGLGAGLAAVLALGLGTGLTLVLPRLAHAANTTDKTCTSASYAHDITTAGTKGIITFDCPSPADIDVRTGSGGPGTVTVATGSTLSLTDIGASVTLDGEHAVQLFVVNGGGSLTLDHLIVAYGQTGSDGGGILNDSGGALTITNDTFSGDTAICTLINNFNGFLSGGDCFGGGLANFGTATIADSTFSSDTADGTSVVNPNGFATGGSGDGGGLYNRGTATITDSTFSGDTAAGGEAIASGSIGTNTVAEGGNGGGGGLENDGGTVTISSSTFSGDIATGGGSIGGVATLGEGGSGFGGALSNVGTLTITDSTFSGDSATGGGGTNTGFTSSGQGGDGFGGALFTAGTATTATISGSTFSGDSATGGGGAGAAAGSAGTGAGGALNNGGTLTITNSTLTGDSATGGEGFGAATGGNGLGGALINSLSATITNATLSGNSATGGAPGGSGLGGALEAFSNTITVTNSIVAVNTASGTPGPNCIQSGGTVTDGGNNLEDGSGPTDCGFSAANHDQFAATPSQLGLGGLGNHGGPTQTMALAPGSLALGHANLVVCTNTTGPNPVNGVDQRGVHRPQGTGCDIGAFELQRPITLLRVAGPIFVAPGVPNIRYVSGETIFILTATTSGDGVAPAMASYCVAAVGSTCSNFTTVQSGSLPATFSLVGGDGPYTVSAYASDSFGDQGAIQVAAYTLDTTPPAATLTIGQPQATVDGQIEVTSRTPLTLSATDAGSGVASVSYRFFREGRGAPAFTVVRGAKARFKLTGPDGVYEVDYLATDHVGNVHSYSVMVVLANGQLHVATQT
jgi:hypothetical protein